MQRINPGWALLAWMVIAAALALNRGIDLLWGMTALLMAAMVMAVLLPRLQIAGLSVRREMPAKGITGQALTFQYEIEAPGWFPRYGIELYDRLGADAEPVPAAYFSKLSNRRSYRFTWTPPVRGRLHFDRALIQSQFPLGLSTARRSLQLARQELIVYPDFVHLINLPVDGEMGLRYGNVLTRRRHGRDEFFGLKPYRAGDDLRAMDWRSSAHAGELLLREFERTQDPQLWIVLDLSAHDHVGTGAASTSEYMFRIAHSVAVRAREDEVPAGLVYRQRGRCTELAPALEHAAYLRLRECLALTELEDNPPLESWLRLEQQQLPAGGTWMLFNLGGAQRRNALLQMCGRRNTQALIVEFDTESFTRPSTGLTPQITLRREGGHWISTVPLGADLSRLFGAP